MGIRHQTGRLHEFLQAIKLLFCLFNLAVEKTEQNVESQKGHFVHFEGTMFEKCVRQH